MQISKIISTHTNYTPKIAFSSEHINPADSNSDSTLLDFVPSYMPVKTQKNNEFAKVFEGMTKKEIDFVLDNLYIIATTRGCSNRCIHCYASALPIQKEHDNFISRMPYEDYIELINGIGKAKKQNPFKFAEQMPAINLYFDSDCMELGLFDKKGEFHDFTDLHKVYYDATEEYSLFDTAGWNYKQTKMQERAEKYVKYLNANSDKFYQINLSLSPFNPLYAKAIEYGYNPQKYSVTKLSEPPQSSGEKLYREYIEKMANMLFTFTPLIGKENFGIIVRPVDNNEKNLKEYSVNAYKNIRLNILNRLYQKYKEDLEGEQKYIKSEQSAFYYLQQYMHMTDNQHP